MTAPSPDAATGVRARVSARTDVGRVREHNEDAFLVADLDVPEPLELAPPPGETAARPAHATPVHVVDGSMGGLLVAVADGLGGAAAGEVASHLAVRTAFDTMRASTPDAAHDALRFATALRDAVHAANAAIHHLAAREPTLHGMATTLTAAALHEGTLFLAQVGDSRAYVVRDGAAQQITKDQSLVQKLVDAGELTPEQAETSLRRNIILQALGPEPAVKVDVTRQPLRRGDLLLLCSDGLSGQLRASDIAGAAAEAEDVDAFCAALVARANATGGPDNITVVAARFDGDALVAESDGAAMALGHHRFTVTPANGTPAAAPALGAAPTGDDLATPPVVAGPAAPPAEPDAAPLDVAARRRRARAIYAALGVAALGVAGTWVWWLLHR